MLSSVQCSKFSLQILLTLCQVLSNLFAVKSELCGKKFEIKINDIRFVGHPLLVYQQGEGKSAGSNQESVLSFNVVFALKVIQFSPLDLILLKYFL